MSADLRKRFIIVLCVIVACFACLFPIHKRINLGLDLKGGMHLILKVQNDNLPTAQIKHLRQRHVAEMHHFLRRTGVHVLEAVLQSIQLSRRHQIGPADEDLVGKAHLATRFLAVVELLGGVFGIHQGQD